MKKWYVLLVSFTVLAIGGMPITRSYIEKSRPTVTLYETTAKLVQDTVVCTGRIESVEAKDVYTEIPCIIGDVYVKVGDTVKEGDTLFSIDKDGTKQVLAEVGNISEDMIPEASIPLYIKSTTSGVVRSLNAEKGQAVDNKTPCVTISASDGLQVKVSVHENNLKSIKIGQTAVINGSAFTKSSYYGKVTFIAPYARQQYSGTTTETVVDAIITLDEKDESLKPGLSAKSRILINSTPNCIVVPYEYVLQDENNNEFVYVYENHCAVKRVILTGKELYEGFQVLEGLSPGEQIIANPADIQKSGEKVNLHMEEVSARG